MSVALWLLSFSITLHVGLPYEQVLFSPSLINAYLVPSGLSHVSQPLGNANNPLNNQAQTIFNFNFILQVS